jgi:hypothetical protein
MTVVADTSIGDGFRFAFLHNQQNRFYNVLKNVSVVSTSDVAAFVMDNLDLDNPTQPTLSILNQGQIIGAPAVAVYGDANLAITNAAGAVIALSDDYTFRDVFGFTRQTSAIFTTSDRSYDENRNDLRFGQLNLTNFGDVLGFNSAVDAEQGLIANFGTIAAGGYAVSLRRGGSITNSGTIRANIAVDLGAHDTVNNNVHNSGTISGGAVAINDERLGGGPVTDVIYNTGTIVTDYPGAVAFQSAGNRSISFFNSGSITGNVNFANEGTNVFDSSLGEVFGRIDTVGGSSTIVGAVNGGTIAGGHGNDVLIANQGQQAADAAVQAVLSGGGGINALYGGGAYNTLLVDNPFGFTQVWGGASKMTGVEGYDNNLLSFAQAPGGAYIDLRAGHNNAYLAGVGQDWQADGSTLVASIANIHKVVGSSFGDVIGADEGIDRIDGGGGSDALYANAQGQATFVYTAFDASTVAHGYDGIEGFKIGTDKIDVSALHLDASHLLIDTLGKLNSVYLMHDLEHFDSGNDLAISINASTTGGLTTADFIF